MSRTPIGTTACAAAYLTLLLTRVVLARRHAARRHPRRPGDELRLTVLQAIRSGDPDLAAVLTDTVRELPRARFRWLVDQDDPEGCTVARAVADAHPEVAVEVSEHAPPGPRENPKVVKLHAATFGRDDDVLLVLDDDTRLPRATALELVGALDTHDLSTGLPLYLPARTPWGRLVEQLVTSTSALTYLPMAALGEPRSLNGMTYALTGATLRGLGGFGPLRGTLVDDLAVAQALHRSGGRIAQLAAVQHVATTVSGPREYAALLHRWMLFARLLLERETPGWRARLVGLVGLPAPLLLAVVATGLRTPGGRWVVLGTLAVRHAVVAATVRRLGHPSGQGARVRVRVHPLWSVLAELLQPAHVLHALASRTITWRQHRYRVRTAEDFVDLAGVPR